MAYYQLKHQCLYCDAAFVVYTETLSLYDINKTYCPQCGATGTCLRHDTIHDGEIDDIVPGDSSLSMVAEHVEEEHIGGELHSYALKQEIRTRMDKAALYADLKALLTPNLRALFESKEREYGYPPFEDGPAK